MTFARPTTQTRRLEPSWRPWTPEDYQLRASEFLMGQGAAMLWLDPGLRKTSIVLNAFCGLQRAGRAKRMLVVAPRRVCQLVWRQEAAKWEDFRHLKVEFMHGPKKAKVLHGDADVVLMNPEGAVWLAKQFERNPDAWPFDVVLFDEITKFKNSQSERSKALRGRSVQGRLTPNLLKRSAFRWGMTGTPNPNGYMDLFGQFLMVDDGAALGRFITHYRDSYFTCGFNGFDYDLQPGGATRIQSRLGPYVFALDAEDLIKLPELLDDIIEIELEPEAWAAYEAMRKTMVAQLPEGTLEAANKATAYNKLSQMAGGAVYMEDHSVVELHSAKLDALSDLMDEMGDRQLLVGYEFNHEKDRMKARFGNRMSFLADARTDAQAEQMQADWNAGRIQFLACHPASAGHGLNFQEGGAAHLCWFGPIWDLELWDQFIRRLRRSGNEAERVVRHTMVVRNSIDELKLQALAEKDTSQTRLKSALTTVLNGEQTDYRRDEMVAKLSRAGATAPAGDGARTAPAGWSKPAGGTAPVDAPENTATTAADTGTRAAPAGWGKPATGGAQAAEPTQREEIREKLTAEPEGAGAAEVSGGFSDNVIALKSGVESGQAFEGGQAASPETLAAAERPPENGAQTRSRAPRTSAPPASGLSVSDIKDAVREALNDNTASGALQTAPYDHEADQRRYADESTTRQLAELIGSAKTAAEAVQTLGLTNPDAAQDAYEKLFAAIEKRLGELGYGSEEAA